MGNHLETEKKQEKTTQKNEPKMLQNTSFTLAIATIFSVVMIATQGPRMTNALDCVECSSCQEVYDASVDPSETCKVGLDACMKTFLRYPGGASVQKQCALSSAVQDRKQFFFGYGFETIACTDGDNCNAAMKSSSASFMILIAASLLISVLLF